MQAATPGGTGVSLLFSNCSHAVRVGEGSGATLWTTLHCRIEDNVNDGALTRWWEIDLNNWPFSGGPSIAQWGEVDKRGNGWECYYPCIAVNGDSDMALTWTQSGAASGRHMEMWRGLRCHDDSPGTLPDTELLVECGDVIDGLSVDYVGMALDPEDPTAFFAHSALVLDPANANQWQTWIAEYSLDCKESGGRCYADCDRSSGRGTLDIFDFLCFQTRYDARDLYACDCDTGTGPAVCDVFDFLCHQSAYDAGCP